MTDAAPIGADALLARIEHDAELLAAAATTAGWDDPVPGLDWSVRDVVVHTGAVHRWSADIVRRALDSNETGGSRAFHPALPDDELPEWFGEGYVALGDTLRAATDDLEAWTMMRGAPARRFWIRRQAHETAIHRADVEAAARGVTAVTDVGADFAQDGIDELAAGFARRRAFSTEQVGTLSLTASDGPSWLIRFGGQRIDAARATGGDGAAGAVVSGTSAELYRWLWNRPAPVRVSGDETVAALWSRQVRI